MELSANVVSLRAERRAGGSRAAGLACDNQSTEKKLEEVAFGFSDEGSKGRGLREKTFLRGEWDSSGGQEERKNCWKASP